VPTRKGFMRWRLSCRNLPLKLAAALQVTENTPRKYRHIAGDLNGACLELYKLPHVLLLQLNQDWQLSQLPYKMDSERDLL
jgi:hypothetical protein